jgi:hypothetical protein
VPCARRPGARSLSATPLGGSNTASVHKRQTWLLWATLFAAIAAVEGLVRFAIPFRLERVLVVEAVLFFAAALVTLFLIQRPPSVSKWRRRLQWVLVWAFGLGSARAAIWAAGQPVRRANLAILLMALLVLISSWLRRRGHRAQAPVT